MEEKITTHTPETNVNEEVISTEEQQQPLETEVGTKKSDWTDEMKKLDNQLAPALLGAVSEQKKSTEQLKRERDLKEQENNPKEQKECPSLIVEILKKLGRYEEAIDKCFEYVEEKYYLYDYARKIAKKYVPARQAEIANSIMKIGIKRWKEELFYECGVYLGEADSSKFLNEVAQEVQNRLYKEDNQWKKTFKQVVDTARHYESLAYVMNKVWGFEKELSDLIQWLKKLYGPSEELYDLCLRINDTKNALICALGTIQWWIKKYPNNLNMVIHSLEDMNRKLLYDKKYQQTTDEK